VVGIEDSPGNVFVLLDPESLKVHREVRILIGTDKVVSRDTRIETVVSPGATDGGISFKDDQGAFRVQLSKLLRSSQAVQTYEFESSVKVPPMGAKGAKIQIN
jgi:hypothetical protein